MDTTVTIEATQIDALAERLSSLESQLSDTDRITLLAVFALAGEALDARIDAKTDVAGFALNVYNVGLQVGVPSTLPDIGGDLQAALKGRKAGSGQHDYLKVTLKETYIS